MEIYNCSRLRKTILGYHELSYTDLVIHGV